MPYKLRFSANSHTSLRLVVLAGICFGISIWAMAPGWLTTDSLNHFVDARAGVYRDMFPVLLAWIWNKLLFLNDGPFPMLVLSVAPYWAGFYYLAEAARVRVGSWAILIPILGFWPGIYEQVGFIWKDIIFGTMTLFVWGAITAAYFQKRKLRLWERIVVPIALIIGVGVKPNGITALPFIIGAWLYIEKGSIKNFLQISIASVVASVAIALTAFTLTAPSKIIKQENFMWQYTQIYDLLGMSVASNKVLLPPYITEQRSADIAELRKSYWAGGVGPFFFHKGGSLATADRTQIKELFTDWHAAIKKYPLEYLQHRWANLSAMLRIGEFTPAWVGEPGIWENPLIPPFNNNIISDALGASIKKMPWAYLPWAYAALAGIFLVISLLFTRERILAALMAASSAAFFGPHFFLLPAADYRYLYYCYLMAFATGVVAIAGLFKDRKLKEAK
jgi:hypothetical protein